ncbi:MAG: four helix bundle protein [Gemmatimonadales bacterium]
MRDPNRLRVAEAALRVAELTYDVTRRLPLDERTGLSLQMRRAAISIGSNITEGCGRSTDRQFLSFLQIAMGSACELEFQCRVATRVGLADDSRLKALRESIISTKRMLTKLSEHVRDSSHAEPERCAPTRKAARSAAAP